MKKEDLPIFDFGCANCQTIFCSDEYTVQIDGVKDRCPNCDNECKKL